MIKSLALSRFLSFGPANQPFPMNKLNVLIGANGSGKSNLLEAIGILQAAPRDLLIPIREGGGVREWIWKGSDANAPAELNVVLNYPSGKHDLRHRLCLTQKGNEFLVRDERIEAEEPDWGHERPYFFFGYEGGSPTFNVRPTLDAEPATSTGRIQRRLKKEDLDPHQSVLSQRRDPDQYPEITFIVGSYSQIRIYREWNFGRYTAPRQPQKVDLPADFLLEDASNLALVINRLKLRGDSFQRIRSELKELYEQFDSIDTIVDGTSVQVFFYERGLRAPIPATRLSDGTLRFVCLLAILCHPEPPPMVCIEEPELGLHPEVIPTVARLLVEASFRTQLIVTTHSSELVSALSDQADAVVTCERNGGGTNLKRLEPNSLAKWLDRYKLGELWLKGEIGATRW